MCRNICFLHIKSNILFSCCITEELGFRSMCEERKPSILLTTCLAKIQGKDTFSVFSELVVVFGQVSRQGFTVWLRYHDAVKKESQIACNTNT